MERLEIINKLISKNSYCDYLEIGVSGGYVLNNCIAKNKIGVDPSCDVYRGNFSVICKTSDEYFKDINDNVKFDIIFIDGYHEAEQVFRDVVNSLKHLNENGVLVLHDCNPPQESYSLDSAKGGAWTGNVYSGYIDVVKTYDLDHYTVNVDWGCGVIKYKDIDVNAKRLRVVSDWKYFENNRNELLNLITFEEFKNNVIC